MLFAKIVISVPLGKQWFVEWSGTLLRWQQIFVLVVEMSAGLMKCPFLSISRGADEKRKQPKCHIETGLTEYRHCKIVLLTPRVSLCRILWT